MQGGETQRGKDDAWHTNANTGESSARVKGQEGGASCCFEKARVGESSPFVGGTSGKGWALNGAVREFSQHAVGVGGRAGGQRMNQAGMDGSEPGAASIWGEALVHP